MNLEGLELFLLWLRSGEQPEHANTHTHTLDRNFNLCYINNSKYIYRQTTWVLQVLQVLRDLQVLQVPPTTVTDFILFISLLGVYSYRLKALKGQQVQVRVGGRSHSWTGHIKGRVPGTGTE